MIQVRTHSIVGISLILILCSCKAEPSESSTVGKSLEDPTAESDRGLKVITAWWGYSNTPSEWYISAMGQAQLITGTRRPDREEYEGKVIDIYDIQINRRFDFDGGELLQYTSGMEYYKVGSFTFYHRFGTHTNHFSRDRDAGIPSTGKALDESGKLLGKATVKRYLVGLGVEIEDTHMASDGKPYFRALSHYCHGTELKVYEKTEFGKKRQELFPVWPTSQ